MIESKNPDIRPAGNIRLCQFLRTLTRTEVSKPVIGLNLPGGGEGKLGRSYTNPHSVKLICFLLKLIYVDNKLCAKLPSCKGPGQYLDVLVLTKYKQRAHLISKAVDNLPPTLIPKFKIKVSMVQVAQGGQAKLVIIIDETRDQDRVGYIGQSQLTNRAITRAEWGVINIYCNKLWRGGPGNLDPTDERVKNLADLDE
jgi:hypothetical protein